MSKRFLIEEQPDCSCGGPNFLSTMKVGPPEPDHYFSSNSIRATFQITFDPVSYCANCGREYLVRFREVFP